MYTITVWPARPLKGNVALSHVQGISLYIYSFGGRLDLVG